MKRILATILLVGGLSLAGCSAETDSISAPTETVYITAEPEVVTVEAEPEVVTETVTETVTVEAEPEVVTETVTVEAEPEAPVNTETEFNDFFVEVTACGVDSWGDATAELRVTNNSAATLDISGTIEIIDAVTRERHSTIIFYEELVAGGQTVNTTAVGWDGAPATFECNVISIDGYDW